MDKGLGFATAAYGYVLVILKGLSEGHKQNKLDISLYTRAVGGNVKSNIFMTLTLKMYPLTPKSTGFVFDLYPTMVLNTNPLGHTMPEKSGRQTYKHTDRQTDKQTDKQTEPTTL